MDEQMMMEVLKTALYEWDERGECEEGDTEVRSIETFAEHGVLTSDTGLVATLDSGKKFHITVTEA